jgi:hypothetical protein
VDLYLLLMIICRLTDKQIADAITSLERQSLRDKMAHWGDELNEEEIERLSEEGINQMVGDIPGHYYLTKSRSYVENRIKIGISAIAIVLGGIYGYVNKKTKSAIAVLMENGEVIAIMYCSIPPMIQMDQRT